MPSWWRKSSSKLKKKSSGESIIDWQCIRPGASRKRRSTGKKESQSGEESQPSSLSEKVSRNVGFSEKPQPQPLPLPQCTESSMCRSFKNSLFKPPSKPGQEKIRKCAAEGEIDFISNSSDSSSDTDDPSDSRILSPQASDYENGIQSAIASPWGKQVDQFPIAMKKNSIQMLMPKNISSVPSSPALRPSKSHINNLQIPYRGVLSSAPDSSKSSPSRSPIQFSGQCSSPGSGQNSVAGDISSQFLWPHSRNSPECSPLPSPRMTSPGPSSRIQSGATTPLHPGIGVQSTGSPRLWPDDRNKTSHRLPLPPVTIPRAPYLMGSSPGIPRSPGMAENPPSPGSPWKKGRLLGRGTFGHVYIGFNSETGEMCAMKEVALFSDDSKSKDSTQQLGQEVAMLSKLRHPNIVQYYGSATFGDKLYIYLEYVSGGSIHKILQDYGQLGEAAIRSYTQQILSGLAYLHAKNTLHRDIKGANILVDPSGRVKLADFGMAKHITGQSCPLSLKGSPYWMAPEVIQNTGSCNLAVDIWSLGCTVLEMATTKPPWSQYEGIAAMFKVGNSKELPAIPDNLSDEGQDFVMQCLQRDPSKRPTAAQLMEHPFVRNTATLERPILSFEPFAKSAVLQSMRVLDIGRSRTPLSLDSPGTVNHSKSPKRVPGLSNACKARNTSCPVSPIGSPLSHPRSPQMHLKGQFSHSPMLSPRPASGSSTPPPYGSLTPPLYMQPANYFQESAPMISRFQKNLNLNPKEHKPDIYREVALFPGNNVEPALLEVSQQLLRNPLRLHHTVFDLNPNCPTPKRNNA